MLRKTRSPQKDSHCCVWSHLHVESIVKLTEIVKSGFPGAGEKRGGNEETLVKGYRVLISQDEYHSVDRMYHREREELILHSALYI